MITGSITLTSAKTAWHGRIDYTAEVEDGAAAVSATLVTWKSDGAPSSSMSGASFSAWLTVGDETAYFTFPQQEAAQMTVGTLEDVVITDPTVVIEAQVTAPSGVSMYGYPLSGGAEVTLLEGEELPSDGSSAVWTAEEEVRMGEDLILFIRRGSTACTHTLKAAFGSYSKTIAKDVATGYTWRIPDLAAYCPNAASGTLTVTCLTYKNGSRVGDAYKTTLRLLVPEPTAPDCAASVNMGSKLAVTLDRGSASFTHTLACTFAGKTETIGENLTTSASWAVPLDLAARIPSLTKDTCTLQCRTYNGTALVGTRTASVTLKVPLKEATRPGFTVTLSPRGLEGTAFEGLYIRGITKIAAAFDASSTYSSVAKCALTVDGVTAVGNPAVAQSPAGSGQVTVTATVTDARGYSRSVTKTLSVLAYDRPSVIPCPGMSAVVCTRCRSDGTPDVSGQSLLIRAGRRYTALTVNGEQKNFCTLHWRSREAEGDYGSWNTVLAGGDLSRDWVDMVVENALPDMTARYAVQLAVEDTLGSAGLLTEPVAGRTVPLHLGPGGQNVAVGKYCDLSRSAAFEVGLTTYFDTGIAPRPLLSGGTWPVGTELGTAVPDSDAAAAELYTLFLAVCAGEPVLLVRLGSRITGGSITLNAGGGQLLLLSAPESLTGLYALL